MRNEKMKAKKIDAERWADRDWGDVVSCEATAFSEEWPYGKGTCVPDRNPWEAMCIFSHATHKVRNVLLQ